jgi:cytochrome c oxidase subunit 2
VASRVHQLERAFLWLGAAILVAFLGALFFASIAMGINLPGKVDHGIIDPAQVRTTAPFDDPGVRANDDGGYDVVMRGEMWRFVPAEIVVPAGEKITFIATSPDVIHGLHIENTMVNMMIIPGQIGRNTYTFDEPGEHLIICHEYCGPNHHTMHGTLTVVPMDEFEARQAAADAGEVQ